MLSGAIYFSDLRDAACTRAVETISRYCDLFVSQEVKDRDGLKVPRVQCSQTMAGLCVGHGSHLGNILPSSLVVWLMNRAPKGLFSNVVSLILDAPSLMTSDKGTLLRL